jgi:hydroxyethylthiazole kinase-like uncharacterized protein yjeF
MTSLTKEWLRHHPLPQPGGDTDKNDRGRVLAVGGSAFVPGALRLTGEAALRAGAGKVQLGTIRDATLLLGMMMPEAAVLGLPADTDGEVDASAVDALRKAAGSCDTLVIGPGMGGSEGCASLVSDLVASLPAGVSVVLDAAAIPASRGCGDTIRSHAGAMLLTPHHGEMAALTGLDVERVAASAEAIASEVAADLNALVVLKAARTVIADAAGEVLTFEGGTPGLATGGSGDVLAGVLAGLLAREAQPLVACAWAVWTHARAGALLTERYHGLGLLGRELPALIPEVLNGGAPGAHCGPAS